jgi:hypothetical protein
MNIGDKLTTKKHAFIFHFHKGGGSAKLAKRGTPGLYTKRAGRWRRNKYIPATPGWERACKYPYGAFFGDDLQCYGEYRYEPGDVIGEIVGLDDEFIEVIIESKNFKDYEVEVPFRVALGIKIDRHTEDAFQSAEEQNEN